MRITSEREIIRRSPAMKAPGGRMTARNGASIQRPYLISADGRPVNYEGLAQTYGELNSSSNRRDSLTRCMDFSLAAIILLFVLPLLMVIFGALKLTQRGPMLFAHCRVGRDGVPFSCLKFRTMYCDADQRLLRLLAEDPSRWNEWANTQKLVRDPRVTPVGRFLRLTSLDELPQLINVLRGDMSLVGPRPVIEDELERYGRYAEQYCSVRPGLTGLWQVIRNPETSYRRRVAADVHYVRNRSVGLDIYILLATIPAVLQGNG